MKNDAIRHANSIPELFAAVARSRANAPAQWQRTAKGAYEPISYQALWQRALAFATGLIRHGLLPGDRVAILMENRPEWAVVDFGTLAAGGVLVPLYTTARTQELAYVLADAGARWAVVSAGKLADKLAAAVQQASLQRSVQMIVLGAPTPEGALAWDAFVQAPDERAVAERLHKLTRDSLASLVYTSGTTGDPKGVMLSHGNFLANIEGASGIVELRADDRMLSFLPLAHALERTAGHYFAYAHGISVAFAERPDTLAKNMQEAQPTLLVAVPRVLEVVRARLLAQVEKQPARTRRLFRAWLNAAMRVRGERKGGLGARVMLAFLDPLVGKKVRARFGGRLRLVVSGGAPLAAEVGRFFDALGIPVIEGYGMTEAAPVISVNPPARKKFGTVGPPLPNVEVQIAPDGEILARGPNVMQGYWNKPEATHEALDEEGWLHTGDLGRLDEDGYLIITDRKKDILVNSGGENIAPQKIEARLAADEFIAQAVVYGDGKPYLVALIAPEREACEAWAREEGLPEVPWEQLVASKALKRMLQTRINRLLAGFAPHEQVRRIHLLAEPLTIESGLVTPTLKIKRKKVYARFHKELEALYKIGEDVSNEPKAQAQS